MHIKFSRVGDIQVVILPEPLSAVEISAVRFKLEEKISKGRQKILFDLSDYPAHDDHAIDGLMQLLMFTVNMGTLVATSCVDPANWPRLATQPTPFLKRKIF
jgi:anti-anti-sigma regulatory factor